MCIGSESAVQRMRKGEESIDFKRVRRVKGNLFQLQKRTGMLFHFLFKYFKLNHCSFVNFCSSIIVVVVVVVGVIFIGL